MATLVDAPVRWSPVMPEWLTTKEAAAYLKVSRATLFNYTSRGVLQWYAVPGGRGRRFKREDLDQLLQAGHEAKPPPARTKTKTGTAEPSRPTLVAAVIADGDRVLMTRRRYFGEREMWSWPAGHVEPEEHPADAVLRELNEELRVSDATIVRHLGDVDYHGDVHHWWPKSGRFRYGYRMIHYQVALSSNAVEIIDHEELIGVDWLTLDQVRQATASLPARLANAALNFAREAIRYAGAATS